MGWSCRQAHVYATPTGEPAQQGVGQRASKWRVSGSAWAGMGRCQAPAVRPAENHCAGIARGLRSAGAWSVCWRKAWFTNPFPVQLKTICTNQSPHWFQTPHRKKQNTTEMQATRFWKQYSWPKSHFQLSLRHNVRGR